MNPESGWRIKPIHFEMKINECVVGFLGGKCKIKMYDSRVVANDTLPADHYEINSQVDLSAYLMGIKMKNFGYEVVEIVDKKQGLVFQKFVSRDGSCFVFRLQKEEIKTGG